MVAVLYFTSLDSMAYCFGFSVPSTSPPPWGWSDDAMVLGKLPVPGRPTIWVTVGQGPTALAVGAGGGRLDIFILVYPFSPLSPSLWETARYRLKYCLKGPLNQNQPTTSPHSPSPPPSAFFFLFRYGFFVKIYLLESSKLEL